METEDSIKRDNLHEMWKIYDRIHDGPVFDGKDTIHFILIQEIVRLNKEVGNPQIREENLFGCSNCKLLFKYHQS